MFEELELCQLKISQLKKMIAILNVKDIEYLGERVWSLEQKLAGGKRAARFISELLAVEYEVIDIDHIKKELNL